MSTWHIPDLEQANACLAGADIPGTAKVPEFHKLCRDVRIDRYDAMKAWPHPDDTALTDVA
jgi:hypothetical protein